MVDWEKLSVSELIFTKVAFLDPVFQLRGHNENYIYDLFLEYGIYLTLLIDIW